MNNGDSIPGSFRDPSGFLFQSEGILYRQINSGYKENYEQLVNSKLYETLVDKNLLISHRENNDVDLKKDGAFKIIEPELIPFISYPYEWCFSQYKAAALTTLEIQKTALDFEMSLKDCSAYNIQFRDAQPIFIDTLSFEKYDEGKPWVAYRQFCQHFLAPLALMSRRDIRLGQLIKTNMDGIPLDLASRLLPGSTKFNFSLLTHIHLHAKSQKKYADKRPQTSHRKMSKLSMLGLVDSLKSSIDSLKWTPQGTEWIDYYQDTNYSSEMLSRKKELVTKFLKLVRPGMVWDLGANTGLFSRIAAEEGCSTISFDIDPACVEQNYRICVHEKEKSILPLLLDLSNPSPAIGWQNQERMSLVGRGPVDMIMALALIHHLAISNNVPLGMIADFFRNICRHLIIEFVPKSDSQVQRLLATREDIFSDYGQDTFEKEFEKYFDIKEAGKIENSQRTLYLMKRK